MVSTILNLINLHNRGVYASSVNEDAIKLFIEELDKIIEEEVFFQNKFSIFMTGAYSGKKARKNIPSKIR